MRFKSKVNSNNLLVCGVVFMIIAFSLDGSTNRYIRFSEGFLVGLSIVFNCAAIYKIRKSGRVK